jgi:hypothetical protein
MNGGPKTGPTGPRTSEGKAVASRNALKHGLLSRVPILPDEDEEVFLAFRARLHDTLCPQGEFEFFLVERVVVAAWRLRRLERVAADIFAWHYLGEVQERARARARSHETTVLGQLATQEIIVTNAKAHDAALEELSRIHAVSRQREDLLLRRAFIRDGTQIDALAKLARYEAGLERTLDRTLAELRRVQAARLAQAGESDGATAESRLSAMQESGGAAAS